MKKSECKDFVFRCCLYTMQLTIYEHKNCNISKIRAYFCAKFCSLICQITVHKSKVSCCIHLTYAETTDNKFCNWMNNEFVEITEFQLGLWRQFNLIQFIGSNNATSQSRRYATSRTTRSAMTLTTASNKDIQYEDTDDILYTTKHIQRQQESCAIAKMTARCALCK